MKNKALLNTTQSAVPSTGNSTIDGKSRQQVIFKATMKPKAQIVVHFIRGNLHRELSLDDLARLAGVTRSHLCYMLKAETGTPPMQYLKNLRMQKACELLETTCLSVKEIISKVGVQDESHFLRDFKKVYGCTPSQYRAAYFGFDRQRTR